MYIPLAKASVERLYVEHQRRECAYLDESIRQDSVNSFISMCAIKRVYYETNILTDGILISGDIACWTRPRLGRLLVRAEVSMCRYQIDHFVQKMVMFV